MRVAIISVDLLLASRILDEAQRRGHDARLLADPRQLADVDPPGLVFVNWADRGASWGSQLAAWTRGKGAGARVVLYGPHVDLAAHAAAKDAGIGPMLGRSALISQLDALLTNEPVAGTQR